MLQKIRNRSATVVGRFGYLLAAVLLVVVLLPSQVYAAQLTSRKLTLGTSQGNTSTTWTFQFTTVASTALNGIAIQVCDAASGTCNAPGSWTNSGSAFGSLTYNGSNQTGWTLDNTAGFLRAKNNSSAVSVTNPVVLTFNTVTNPNTTNATFYARIVTYSGDDFTTAVDSGVVATSTAQQISVTGTVDEALTFCVGISGITNSSCSGATGSAINFNTITSSATSSSISQIGVGTNAAGGYTITVFGNTLTAAGGTIDALAVQTAAATGSEQFGINLRDNATPDVGLDPDGSGTATPTATYNTANQYRFVSGDTIASKGTGDAFRRFHVSYIANISTGTEAGVYSTTLTYIATATF